LCKNGLARVEVPDVAPPIMHFALSDPLIVLDPALNVMVSQIAVRYALRFVLYMGGNHFTTRMIKENGDIWYHDGIETGVSTVAEGNIHSKDSLFMNTCMRNDEVRQACGALYALIN
jgi:hypothetical protein